MSNGGDNSDDGDGPTEGRKDSGGGLAALEPGAVVDGKYRIERVLGQGGMGVVVSAMEMQLERRVAIKFLLPGRGVTAEMAARLLREARAIAGLDSEHVVKLHGFGELPNGAPYMVMEYLEGEDLRTLLDRKGRLEMTRAVDTVLEAAEALAAAHAVGIVHRDVKPSNLFLARRRDRSLVTKVLDFGIATAPEGLGLGDAGSLTRPERMMGSPAYMSPEQMRSAKDVDARTDIWALGLILYEALAGARPFQADTLPQLVLAVSIEDPEPLDSVIEVPMDLVGAVHRCLEKDRSKRFGDVASFARAVAPFGGRRAKESLRRIEAFGRPAGSATWAEYLPDSRDPDQVATTADDLPDAPGEGASRGEGALDSDAPMTDVAVSETIEAEAASHLPPKTRVGEYEIVRMIGQGGFGTVYEAVQPVIGKGVAIKVLSAEFSANRQMVSRFMAEARAVNQIRDRNIVDIFSFGSLRDGRLYYVMGLLEGVPLDRYLSRRGRVTVGEAIAILRPLARALDAAHAANIAHRDLKPENVFLEAGPDHVATPKLLDFGIAKLMGEKPAHVTRTGAALGTPRYMSPEQCRGDGVDHRTDIYSLGVMAHELLTGQVPFVRETVPHLMTAHISDPPPPVSTCGAGLSTSYDAAVLAMLEKDPARRPPTASEAVEAIARAAESAGDPVPAFGDSGLQLALMTSGPSSARGRLGAVGTSAGFGMDSSSSAGAVRRRSRTLTWFGAAAGLLAVAVGLRHLLVPGSEAEGPSRQLASAKPEASPPVVDEPVIAPPEASVAPVPSVEPAVEPATISVLLTTTPARVAVLRGDERVGHSGEPFRLPRGDRALELTLRAPGFEDRVLEVVPSGDVDVDARLRPKPQKPARAQRPSRTRSQQELEF